MKKIIFFDGDGTLWYPKKTKYKEHPVWLYRDPITKKNNNIIWSGKGSQTSNVDTNGAFHFEKTKKVKYNISCTINQPLSS